MRHLILIALLLLSLPARAADDAAVAEIREAWTACTAFMDKGTDDWIGWRRVYDGGYADFFEFWDQSYDGASPSILKETFLIDAIATEQQTSCFRPDGTLAFVFVQMTSPNMAAADGPAITREGRIYVDPSGKVVQVLEQITEAGKKVADRDDDTHQLARGCWALDLHLTTTRVNEHYVSELGDIEGNHPNYQANPYQWCEAVTD